MSIKIEKNIPIRITNSQTKSSEIKEALSKMEIGDSILLTNEYYTVLHACKIWVLKIIPNSKFKGMKEGDKYRIFRIN